MAEAGAAISRSGSQVSRSIANRATVKHRWEGFSFGQVMANGGVVSGYELAGAKIEKGFGYTKRSSTGRARISFQQETGA
jgi:hypothetical protein